MNFFSGGSKGQGTSLKKEEELAQSMQQLEIDMLSDMYNKLSDSCRTKCIATEIKEPELVKGEAVCLDRCVAKYLELHDTIGKKLQEKTMQEQAAVAANLPK